MEILILIAVIYGIYLLDKQKTIIEKLLGLIASQIQDSAKEGPVIEQNEKPFYVAQVDRQIDKAEEWSSKNHSWPEPDIGLQIKWDDEWREHKKVFWFKRYQTIDYPVFSEADIANEQLQSRHLDEEFQYWWDERSKESDKNILMHAAAGGSPSEFNLSNYYLTVVREIRRKEKRIENCQKRIDLKIEANLRVTQVKTRIAEEKKLYAESDVASIASDFSIGGEFDKLVDDEAADDRERIKASWEDQVVRAKEKEKKGGE